VADAERTAAAYAALADPTRLALAPALRGDQELCVCDLAWVGERSQTLVSHHMKQLKLQGLVSARKQGKMTLRGRAGVGAARADRGQAGRGRAAAIGVGNRAGRCLLLMLVRGHRDRKEPVSEGGVGVVCDRVSVRLDQPGVGAPPQAGTDVSRPRQPS
jgi:ArsR family transcriptional regulator, lead/cadmium/zinc/bismuth-responsive transcriptional repressor